LNLGNSIYTFNQLATTGGTINLNGGQLIVTNPVRQGQNQQGTAFNLSGVLRGWLLQSTVNCTIDLQGSLDVRDGNNQIQVGLTGTSLHLHGFTMNIAQGQITSTNAPASRIYLEGGTLNFQGQAPGGPVSGPGTMNGNVIMGAGAMLEASEAGQIGTTTVAGDFSMQDGSALSFQLAASGNDQLAVQGNAVLAGTLSANLLDYIPAEGDVFTIINCGSYEGAFDNSTIELSAGYYLQVDYSDPNSISLVVQVHT